MGPQNEPQTTTSMTAKNQVLISPGLITNLDLREYWGRSGSLIRIATRTGHRDFPARVAIKDVLGLILEQGLGRLARIEWELAL